MARPVRITGSIKRDVASTVVLLSSAARTSSGTGATSTSDAIEEATGLIIVLDVTAQSGTTPTLDVVIQTKIGEKWASLARFAQFGAATGTKALFVRRDLSFATELTVESDPAVGTGLLVNDIDWSTLRAKWAITGGTPSYTFGVDVFPVN